MELLGRLSSPYLLLLIGYCSESNHKLLVYEFMANGGLQEHLYPISGKFFPFPAEAVHPPLYEAFYSILVEEVERNSCNKRSLVSIHLVSCSSWIY